MKNILVVQIGDIEVGRTEIPGSSDIFDALLGPQTITLILDPAKVAEAIWPAWDEETAKRWHEYLKRKQNDI